MSRSSIQSRAFVYDHDGDRGQIDRPYNTLQAREDAKQGVLQTGPGEGHIEVGVAHNDAAFTGGPIAVLTIDGSTTGPDGSLWLRPAPGPRC